MITRLRRAWCLLWHRKLMLPIHRKYLCSKCLIEFPTDF